MTILADDRIVVRRLLDHITAGTTDRGAGRWQEPVRNYLSPERLDAELALLRRSAIVFCPSIALPDAGSYLAREVTAVPIVAVRGPDGEVRAFRNVCRHRGMAVATGTGCQRVLTCPYHGWAYGLDGALRHVPHDDGFPGLDAATHGLVEVDACERHGLVFVSLEGDATPDADMDEIAGLLDDCEHVVGPNGQPEPVNWKVLAETFLEGYHIRSLHRETFYPVQYDNVNLVESFGPHSRITFPYRPIERLADRPPDEWSVDGKLTYVYQLFPNAVVATFPTQKLLFVLEPVAPAETTIVTFGLSPARRASTTPAAPKDERSVAMLLEGGAEDFVAARAIQRGLASGANEHLELGLFESALVHFHRHLDAAVERTGARP